MEYKESEFMLYQKGKSFQQAITHRLGRPPEKPSEVFDALNTQTRIDLTNNKMTVFEGLYGWSYTVKSGRSGEVFMLTKENL